MSRWRILSGKMARRSGFTLIEMTASVVLIVAAVGLTAELVVRVATQQQSLDRRAIALQEASNLLERWAAEDPELQSTDVDPSTLLSDSAKQVLPSGQAILERSQTVEGLSKLAVMITWEDRPGRVAAPVRLTTWISPEGRHSREKENRP